MTEQQVEKLKEYLADLKDLKATLEFPIGAVLISDSDREAASAVFNKEKLEIIDVDGQHPDLALEELIKKIKKGGAAVLGVVTAIPPKIFNQLHNLVHGQVNVQLLDDKKSTILNEWPDTAKVILVMSPDYYDNLPQQELITSVCRL